MKLHRLFAAILTIALAFNSESFTSDAKKKDDKAKYIFLFIGDGMGATHVATAESYLSHLQGKLGGVSLTMSQFPYYGTAQRNHRLFSCRNSHFMWCEDI